MNVPATVVSAAATVTAAVAATSPVSTPVSGTPAGHAAGSYTVFVSQPTIYQTNWTYSSAFAASLPDTPRTSTITDVGYAYSLPTAAEGLQVRLCDQQRCAALPVGDPAGETGAFDGDPAGNSWYFTFRIETPRTQVISPPIISGRHRVTVAYS